MKKILVLGAVVALLVSALVLVSCNLNCPGGGNSGSAGGCKADFLIMNLRECSDECITRQFNKSPVSLSFSCDC
jgi:hypothetical protein